VDSLTHLILASKLFSQIPLRFVGFGLFSKTKSPLTQKGLFDLTQETWPFDAKT
jgi:hypothetical protein